MKNLDVTVTVGGNCLVKNKDYTVAYQNNVKVGTSSVIITGAGNYTGTIKKAFKILPKGTAISENIQSKPRSFTVTWKTQKSVTGYQVQYSTNKKFTNKTTVTKNVKKAKSKKLMVKKLKANQKYYDTTSYCINKDDLTVMKKWISKLFIRVFVGRIVVLAYANSECAGGKYKRKL